MERTPIVTLTTDFGTADGYVGAMKGVILSIVPQARLVDISHQIPPQDVRQAAYVLDVAYPFFPPNAVHLVVVDPGVGSGRRSMALDTPTGRFVGPDNGVFSYVMARESSKSLVALTDPRYHLTPVSQTFHGRDVFAPVAAHLASGVPIATLGPSLSDPVRFPLPRLEVADEAITGEVLHVDHFGNVVTSIGRLIWDGDELLLEPAFGGAGEQACFNSRQVVVEVAGMEIAGVRRTYAESMPGELLTLVGSGSHLEIALREGSAAREMGVRPGDSVILRMRS